MLRLACVVSRWFGLLWFAIACFGVALFMHALASLRGVDADRATLPQEGALVGASTLRRFDRRSGTTLYTLRLPSPCAHMCFTHWHTLFLSCAGVVSRLRTSCSAFGVDYLFSLAVCWFAESPLLIPPLLRLGSVGVLSVSQ